MSETKEGKAGDTDCDCTGDAEGERFADLGKGATFMYIISLQKKS